MVNNALNFHSKLPDTPNIHQLWSFQLQQRLSLSPQDSHKYYGLLQNYSCLKYWQRSDYFDCISLIFTDRQVLCCSLQFSQEQKSDDVHSGFKHIEVTTLPEAHLIYGSFRNCLSSSCSIYIPFWESRLWFIFLLYYYLVV